MVFKYSSYYSELGGRPGREVRGDAPLRVDAGLSRFGADLDLQLLGQVLPDHVGECVH
jgi:hypothetical protein